MSITIRATALLAAVAAMPVAAQPAERSAPLTIDAAAPVAARLNGQPATMRVDPGWLDAVFASPDAALRAGVPPEAPTRMRIGPVEIPGNHGFARIDLDGRQIGAPVSVLDRALVADADLLAGPGSLPQMVVRFRLRPERAGERVTVLPLTRFRAPGRAALGTLLRVGGQPVKVFFTLLHPYSLATAGAGTVIGAVHNGRLDGEPRPATLLGGVERPLQDLVLAQPLAIGPLSLDRVRVRVRDWGRTRVTERTAPDPSEIIVIAAGGPRNRDNDWVVVGSEALAGCSSITFDRPAREIRLSCQ